jgi:putative hydrolase of the HAD superfamily
MEGRISLGAPARALILDYGEVLCSRPAPGMIEKMAALAGMEAGTFVSRYLEERDPYDRGDLHPADYWRKVVSGAAVEEVVDTLRRWDVEMWSEIDTRMTGWIRRLRAAGFKTALLSNMHPDMAAHARRSFDWLRDLDGVTLSCEVRLIKPDRAIYECALDGLGLSPGEALFVDDRDVNVCAARDAGLAALRFQSVDSLRNDLWSMGFPVLPPT